MSELLVGLAFLIFVLALAWYEWKLTATEGWLRASRTGDKMLRRQQDDCFTRLNGSLFKWDFPDFPRRVERFINGEPWPSYSVRVIDVTFVADARKFTEGLDRAAKALWKVSTPHA